MNNVETTNRNTRIGIYLDYTSNQLNQLIETHVEVFDLNAHYMGEDDGTTMLMVAELISAAEAKLNSLKSRYPINIAPEHNTETCEHCGHTHTSTGKYSPDCNADNVRRCPGCGEFDTFSGKYCSDCTSNGNAVSGPNPQF